MAADEDVVWVQLATRIPKTLHRQIRLHCVTAEVSLMNFVAAALAEKLGTSTKFAPTRTARRQWSR